MIRDLHCLGLGDWDIGSSQNMMLLLLLLSPCLSSRIQEQGSRIQEERIQEARIQEAMIQEARSQEARSQEARSQEAILVVGGSVGGAEDQHDSRTTELLLADCPVASLPRVRQYYTITVLQCYSVTPLQYYSITVVQ